MGFKNCLFKEIPGSSKDKKKKAFLPKPALVLGMDTTKYPGNKLVSWI